MSPVTTVVSLFPSPAMSSCLGLGVRFPVSAAVCLKRVSRGGAVLQSASELWPGGLELLGLILALLLTCMVALGEFSGILNWK